MNKQGRFLDSLTARQYGEVVLPDDSTGQSPGTLASKLSRCKEGMAHVFAIRVQSFMAFTSFSVQSCQGISQLSRCS